MASERRKNTRETKQMATASPRNGVKGSGRLPTKGLAKLPTTGAVVSVVALTATVLCIGISTTRQAEASVPSDVAAVQRSLQASWRHAPLNHRFSAAGCGIKRVPRDSPADLDEVALFFQRSEPVIVPLASSWVHAAKNWSKLALYNLAQSDGGGGIVKVGDRKQIVQEQGYVDAEGTTLLEFLDSISVENPPEIALFDQSTFCAKYAELCQSHGIPQTWQDALKGEATAFRTFVSIGPDNSGAGLHDHSDTVFALLHGEKWFVCLPPFSIPTVDVQAQYPGCLLHSGEMLFIPEGWQHVTANVGDAVGISLQSYNYRARAHKLRTQISTAEHVGRSGDVLAHLEDAVESEPEVWEFKLKLAKVLAGTPHLRKTAEQRYRIGELYKEAFSLQPSSCEIVLSAARFHMDAESKEMRSKQLAMSYGEHAFNSCSGISSLDAIIEHATAQAWAGNWHVARTVILRGLELVSSQETHPRVGRDRLLQMMREVDTHLGKTPLVA